MYPQRTILTMKFGSQLYGTDTPQSDLDYKSVFLPSGRDILLGRVQETIVTNTKTTKEEGVRNSSEDVDNENYSLNKFVKLLCQGQPVALDMLFAPEEMFVYTNPNLMWVWKAIRNNRRLFITRQSGSFLGYARQQANKYGIRGSRMGEAEQAYELFKDIHESEVYNYSSGINKVGHISDILEEFVMDKEHCHIEEISNPNGQVIKHFVCCNRKVPYTVTIKEAYNIYKKLYENYGERARKAKNNDGLDHKALSHAVRVGRQAIELAETGNITFPLTYADHLLRIKKGELEFAEVSTEIETLLGEIESAFERSDLPDEPNREWIDNFLVSVYKMQVD